LTGDGKAPDLDPFEEAILKVLTVACRRAKLPRKPRHDDDDTLDSQKAIVIEALPAAVGKVSGGHKSRYSLRRLFYAIRPLLLDFLGKQPEPRQPSFKTFGNIITEYEEEIGHDLPGIYRDTRGILYHPHERREIPLGTLSVENYRRPEWTFNKILYCEKEGFFPTLRDALWPERHDCALLTSKGFATRAARDVLDLLGETDEPLEFFCIHDADGPGTMIHEKLEKGTKARGARKYPVHNLGLEPQEALDMGLTEEPAKRKSGRVPVASYVPPQWREWLQEYRVELDSMTVPVFLDWLDGKFAPFENNQVRGKVVPPQDVLKGALEGGVETLARQAIASRILTESDVDGQVRAAVRAVMPLIDKQAPELEQLVADALKKELTNSWTDPIQRRAAELAALATCRGRQ
jgi:hypothetical protein